MVLHKSTLFYSILIITIIAGSHLCAIEHNMITDGGSFSVDTVLSEFAQENEVQQELAALQSSWKRSKFPAMENLNHACGQATMLMRSDKSFENGKKHKKAGLERLKALSIMKHLPALHALGCHLIGLASNQDQEEEE